MSAQINKGGEMKMHGRAMALALVLSLVGGCAGVKSVYTEVPTEGVVLVDYEGELHPENMKGTCKDEAELLQRRRAEGYRLVGRAEFRVAGNEGWTEAMTRKGREVKAGKIDYVAVYDVLNSGTAGNDFLSGDSSTGPSMAAGGGPSMVNSATVAGAPAPYSFGVDHYVYHVFYFKKVK